MLETDAFATAEVYRPPAFREFAKCTRLDQLQRLSSPRICGRWRSPLKLRHQIDDCFELDRSNGLSCVMRACHEHDFDRVTIYVNSLGCPPTTDTYASYAATPLTHETLWAVQRPSNQSANNKVEISPRKLECMFTRMNTPCIRSARQVTHAMVGITSKR